MLKPAKPKSNVEDKEETFTDKNNKIPCYLVTRSHFSPESSIDGSTPRARNSLGLLPLPLGIPHIIAVELSIPYLYALHDHITRQLTTNNYNYKSAVESHKRLQDLAIGDKVLIRVHPERFSLGTFKKLIRDTRVHIRF